MAKSNRTNFGIPVLSMGAALMLASTPALAGEAMQPAGHPADTTGSYGAKETAGVEKQRRGQNDANVESVLLLIHQLDEKEAQMAASAREGAKSDAVRSYADTINQHQQQSEKAVSALAKKRGVSVDEIVTSQEPVTQKPTGNLKQQVIADGDDKSEGRSGGMQAAGDSFDEQFLATIIEEQSDVINQLQDMRRSSTDPDVRRLVNRTLPVLKQDREQARKLLQDHRAQ